MFDSVTSKIFLSIYSFLTLFYSFYFCIIYVLLIILLNNAYVSLRTFKCTPETFFFLQRFFSQSQPLFKVCMTRFKNYLISSIKKNFVACSYSKGCVFKNTNLQTSLRKTLEPMEQELKLSGNPFSLSASHSILILPLSLLFHPPHPYPSNPYFTSTYLFSS